VTSFDPLKVTFWCSALGFFYAYPGYPMLMWCLARVRPLPASPTEGTTTRRATIILVAHNEEHRIAARLENLLASDYPPASLEVLVVSDGSTDQTALLARTHPDPRVRVLDLHPRAGKAACLNRAVAEAAGEIVVFVDARQRFAADTIARLVRWFGDHTVGAVSGALLIDPGESGAARGVDAYWKLERALREWEARFHSCVGCTGAVYAIRRALFLPLPADTLLDDVVIPMQIAAQGSRVLFDPAAVAFDPQTLEPRRERIRKRRTLAGNFQMLFRYPGWLLPWRHPLWWQLLSHKYMRLLTPAFLMLMLFTSWRLAAEPLYAALLVAQLAVALLGVAGLGLALPAGFLFLNWMVVEAGWHFAFGSRRANWERAS
jgi:cellulose synthase/poly-beta-1,6-N-acetylglucosamine synthase-like glycosyltransferase